MSTVQQKQRSTKQTKAPERKAPESKVQPTDNSAPATVPCPQPKPWRSWERGLESIPASQLLNALTAGYDDCSLPSALMSAVADDLDAMLSRWVDGGNIDVGLIERLVTRCRIAAEMADEEEGAL